MKIVIRCKSTGRVTPVLFQFGQAVNVRGGKFQGPAALSLPLYGVAGTFILPSTASRQLYLAGGIGLTPFLAMIEARRAEDHMTLLLSCRASEVPVFEHLITQAISAASYDNVKVNYHITSDTKPFLSPVNYATEVTLGRISKSSFSSYKLEEMEIFLVGSGGYSEGVNLALKECGVALRKVKTESFLY